MASTWCIDVTINFGSMDRAQNGSVRDSHGHSLGLGKTLATRRGRSEMEPATTSLNVGNPAADNISLDGAGNVSTPCRSGWAPTIIGGLGNDVYVQRKRR